MKEVIAQRIEDNLARVDNLITIYETFLAGRGQGRRGSNKTDLLRAAIVLLHASLEDFLRGLAAWKLPLAERRVIDGIPLVGIGPNAKKFSLGELTAHRGKYVDDVIRESVDKHLEDSNYNDTTQICSLLEDIGVDSSLVNSEFTSLQEMIERRHQIVHRADRDERGGSGSHKVRSLGRKKVRIWVKSVRRFTADVLSQVS